MNYPRTGIVVMLVFLLVAPALSLLLIFPFHAISAVLAWREAVEVCLRLDQAPPPFRWRFIFDLQVLALIYFTSLALYLATAIIPVGWVIQRGSLPVTIVIVSCGLVAVGLALASNALSVSALALFVAVSLACVPVLRWIGVR